MFISTATPIRTSHSSGSSGSLGYDFALLGLRVSEARVDVIRRAASRTAARIQRVASDDDSEAAQMLSDLASSTYRLLDPRRRSKLRERIQLSILDDNDFELQKDSRAPLFGSNWNALPAAAAAS